MAQDTIIMRVGGDEQAEFEERLRAAGFEFRSVDHAHFGVRGDDAVATLYRSGKLVVQGAGASFFVARFLPGSEGSPAVAQQPTETRVEEAITTIGSDEAGKGDYFGPLVVVALEAQAEAVDELRRTGVTDSKKLSDERIAILSPWIADHHEHAIERLDPSDYNAAYAESGNLNELLADMHARAISRLARPGSRVVVDQFANKRLLQTRLKKARVDLIQMPRGERELAVAAASVLARNAFVEGIRDLGDEFGMILHKGAGAPVDVCVREFVALHGRDQLDRVAKLHFKNTAKLDG